MSTPIPNTRVFGAEWVNDYGHPFVPRRSNLLFSGQNATGFCTALAMYGTRRFNYGDSLSWDQDFEQLIPPASPTGAAPSFGDDDSYAEKVDLLYFSGHGTPDGLLFGRADKDNGEARFTEMELGQGGKIKWLVADACRVLEATGVVFRWGRIFKGLRYLLGFHGDCRDVGERGTRFAQHLLGQPGNGTGGMVGEPIWRAWELACLETELAATVSYAYLRIGDSNSVVRHDKWTDHSVEPEPSSLFTYVRHIPVNP